MIPYGKNLPGDEKNLSHAKTPITTAVQTLSWPSPLSPKEECASHSPRLRQGRGAMRMGMRPERRFVRGGWESCFLSSLRRRGKGCLDSTTRQRGPVWSCCRRAPPSSSSCSSSSPQWDLPTDWSARAAPTVESSRKVMTARACPFSFCIPSTRDPWLPRPFSVLEGSCWSCPNEAVAPCRSPPNRVHKWVWGIQFMLCCLRLPFSGAKREIRACFLPLVLRLTWINSRRARHHRPQTGG